MRFLSSGMTLVLWRTARVNIDYHVEFERHYYSVPYQLTGKTVELRATAATLEIFQEGSRIASHARSGLPYQATTVAAHRPKSHQRHLEWTPSRLIEWAQTVGPSTAELFDKIMAAKPHPEMGFRSCLGILRLGDAYSPERGGSGSPPRREVEGLFLSKCQVDARTWSR